VGYGDYYPTKSGAQWFIAFYAVIGVFGVFGIVVKYMSEVQDFFTNLEARMLACVGFKLVDTAKLPIEQYSPADVNAQLSYWRRHLLALSPVFVLFAIFVVSYSYMSALSFGQSFYFGVVTATTIGYGDYNFENRKPALKGVAAAYVVFFVIVFANCIGEVLAIRQRQKLRNGTIAVPNIDDLEQMLLEKIEKQSPSDIEAKREVGVDEADYVVRTLLQGGLVDPQLLLAIRRSYYWAARAEADEACRNARITDRDIHGLRLREASKRAKAASGVLGRVRSATAPVQPAAEPVDVDFAIWRAHAWEPKVQKARAAGVKARLLTADLPERKLTSSASAGG